MSQEHNESNDRVKVEDESMNIDAKVSEALKHSLESASKKLKKVLPKSGRWQICTLIPPWKHYDEPFFKPKKPKNEAEQVKENENIFNSVLDDKSVSIRLEEVAIVSISKKSIKVSFINRQYINMLKPFHHRINQKLQ